MTHRWLTHIGSPNFFCVCIFVTLDYLKLYWLLCPLTEVMRLPAQRDKGQILIAIAIDNVIS